MKEYKISIVCKVYDSYEYLAEFILYHSILVDHIYFIDHKSKRDLRQLDFQGISVVRSNHCRNYQAESVGRIIEHFSIGKQFDWLFLLDIDEFLPFANRSAVDQFIQQNRKHSILHFHWKNGYPVSSNMKPMYSLIDCDEIRFFHRESATRKICVNLMRTKDNFLVPAGAHNILYRNPPWYSRDRKFRRNANVRSYPSNLPLYHIPAFDRAHMSRKISNLVAEMPYRSHVKGRGGWMIRQYPKDFSEASDEDWNWYIANFRERHPDRQYSVKASDFVSYGLFDGISRAECHKLRSRINSLSEIELPGPSPEEEAYMASKRDERAILQNLRWFQVTEENEIVCVDGSGGSALSDQERNGPGRPPSVGTNFIM